MNPSKSINVFLTLDRLVINSYFNKHDPAPIYKRQLSHQFEEYILASVKPAKRYSNIFYKLKYTNEIDKQYAEPVLYAIRRHFLEKKEDKVQAFKKFKKRTWLVLAVSIVIVILCQGLLPHLLNEELRISSGLSHSLDVFAWVILWHPIDELIFQWNPYLKEILLLNKLATAESIILENEKKLFVDNHFPYAKH
ncbi:MAG TPA: hypothetical protein VF623_03265 [Segetibacter sp.]|jgi:hypothetical protein